MDIICISSVTWEGALVKSTLELVKCMAQRHNVLYVDYCYTVKDAFAGLLHKNDIPAKRIWGFVKRLQQEVMPNSTKLWRLVLPPILPANFIHNKRLYACFQRFNSRIVCHSILRAMRKLNIYSPVVFNAWNPFLGVFIQGKLREIANVYYCFDEISTGPWTKEHGPYLERRFLQMADVCVVSSVGLLKAKEPLSRQCCLVQNGVDFERFSRGYAFPKSKPVVIGFVGAIASRLNFDILEAIAKHFPQAQLLLVGGVGFDGRSVDDEVARLKRHANVQFAGEQPSERIPDFLRSFHIGIIPNVKNKQTANVYPMKINEYLAAGLPVVTTDFAPLDEFDSLISIARTTDEFIACIADELSRDSDERREQRKAMAMANSWDNRARAMEEILKKCNDTKKNCLLKK